MQKIIQLTENFSKVNCKDIGTLILTQGNQPSLTIEADEDILAELTAEVRGDTLVLGLDHDWITQIGKVVSSLVNNTHRKVTYHLTVVDLEKISISGKINLSCERFKTDKITLKVSGLGDLDFTELDCDSLDVIISGRGEFRAAGRADQQYARISGSGEYETPHLAGQTMRIIISGQGYATIRVEESLDITISGMGQVNYYGRPKLRQVISGLGKSKRLNDQ
jgi:hypothetical protein